MTRRPCRDPWNMGETFDRSLNRENRVKIYLDIPPTSSKGKAGKGSQRNAEDPPRP